MFICYKELDNLTGQRTQDSVLAQELYRELTDYHLRVFFARITLREKLGVEYEPYIYAALTSAPVMIHVTTSYNNSNAPWVRNEWSRYLSLKNSGSDKSFTVAYKGLNPDIALPKEFSGKQASDLSRVGAMQEIAEWASQAVKRYKEKQGRGHEDEEALKLTISKAFEHLAIGNRNQAEQMFRACLEVDKTCAEAYLGLVMTRRNYMNRRQLGTGMVSLTDDLNFNLAVQYADEDLRRELEAAEAQIQNRIREKREADARKAEEERLEAERKAEAERRRKEQERLEKERAEREARDEEERKRKQQEVRKKKIRENGKKYKISSTVCSLMGMVVLAAGLTMNSDLIGILGTAIFYFIAGVLWSVGDGGEGKLLVGYTVSYITAAISFLYIAATQTEWEFGIGNIIILPAMFTSVEWFLGAKFGKGIHEGMN